MPKVFGIEELTEQLTPFTMDKDDAQDLAFVVHAALKSAVRAAVPGRQQQKNLLPLVEAAQKAFIRTLRRRAK